ncbi:MAG: glycosyltransferase family 2 protein [Pelatocladus maniniholoensis HA4357-MV3]|jgi:glycosyltransferase involved in cell wall biosynthesis|uniref:Glycosyltransferase family 2 protein n=1 Tax=Pelatocladus maniniholoensis HA4357-MV3 TaxID=1117104 RepID=A0A9E3H749_9NOST|nr:glycosyltransferase family 2 protein [Pelatocladus maniniholoensis HA4357-MV3]BAZ68339.1 family 2 glycosyl transferase [Fischerella sp. NIES-4106]
MYQCSPLVSVIIPAYNAEAFISQTLNSVLSQTYKNIEVLVADDGSQDRTPEIVKSIAQKDQRVTLLQQSNQGVAAARNLAIENSRGEYIAPIDADDIWYPLKLERQMQCMLQAQPFVGLVYCWSAWIDEQGSIIGEYRDYGFDKLEGNIYPALVYHNFIGHASSPLIRRTCLEKVGKYNCKLKENKAQGCEDWDLYLRIAENYQFRLVPEFLVGYRQLTTSMSGSAISMARSYELVLTNSQQQHPEVSSSLYQWSKGHFYNYLFGKSYFCGANWNSFLFLVKALQSDLMLFLRPSVYKLFVICLLKVVLKPLTSLIWPDHYSWVQFKQKLRLNKQSNQRREMTIADITEQAKKSKQLWKPYDRVLRQRWLKVMQMCQPPSSQTFRQKISV